ncbi:DNA-binding LytR/AlgR family response regulator [Paenibacillus turicensis]|uniref:DNA-binding LytR/AlgR family response regulator n=1 Tax=Paenibacillus turicensis TaxID=160487 RepID=A0ABS4FUR8_9BACL|nr:LytTR family transcriptional regulator DNA-binding domain-containing protein [Paenibacillus turicensis]MBP1906317.1 DNA-binding LytR/AlgR family response regulator [Paenibacillus turicensis]
MNEPTLKMLIVGDTEQSSTLNMFLESIPNVEVIGIVSTTEDYMDIIFRQHDINAVLLNHTIDADMNVLEAFHLLRLRGRIVPTILITNQTLSASYVADLGIVDILQTPFTFERLKVGIEKQRWGIKQAQFKSSGGIFVPVISDEIRLLTPNDILFIESINRIVYVHTQQGQFESKIPIKLYEKYLMFHDYVLTHRSCLINLHQVEGVHENIIHFKHSTQTAVITEDKKAYFTKQLQIFMNKGQRD